MPVVPPPRNDIKKLLDAIQRQKLHEIHREARVLWDALMWVNGYSTHTADRFIASNVDYLSNTPADL